MRVTFLILVLCFSIACAQSPEARLLEKLPDPVPVPPKTPAVEPQLPFRLEIVPFQKQDKGWSVEYFDGRTTSPSFQVILTNLSKSNQEIYQEHYSWGSENLSFEFRAQTGERYLFRKVPGAFTRNFPATDTIQPGGRKVYTIEFSTSDWMVTPTFGRHGKTIGTLKVLYQVWPSANGNDSVSTGWAESGEYELTIRHDLRVPKQPTPHRKNR